MQTLVLAQPLNTNGCPLSVTGIRIIWDCFQSYRMCSCFASLIQDRIVIHFLSNQDQFYIQVSHIFKTQKVASQHSGQDTLNTIPYGTYLSVFAIGGSTEETYLHFLRHFCWFRVERAKDFALRKPACLSHELVLQASNSECIQASNTCNATL